ncbi:zinc finger CCCH domain-containing protein [Castilleja foliolosa]|uniref:Zinc finger CCCH domain-containing protein n=1 Tax=Castilleja foliolosa TaxID=1961234 RepID=A0ABD3EE65_9LAMI
MYYLRTGTCKYGSSCENHHPKDRQALNPKDSKAESSVLLNILGLPMRQDGKPCPYYMRTGSCKYGYTCKFHHPQPTSAGSVLPMVGSAYGSGGSTVLASNGAPSVGEYSAARSLLHLPQSCVPVILPGSQRWNAYARSFSRLSVTSVLGAFYLPERPDQPECHYYMNQGSCKYGSDCKYHYPRDKTVQLASSSIGPLGLPLGQPVCIYYGLYGLCKYGPTCKYDHPFNGYLYAFNMSSVPPIPTCYSSSSPYQSISSLVSSSETSSPSRSSKSGDWVKKGVIIGDKNNQHTT